MVINKLMTSFKQPNINIPLHKLLMGISTTNNVPSEIISEIGPQPRCLIGISLKVVYMSVYSPSTMYLNSAQRLVYTERLRLCLRLNYRVKLFAFTIHSGACLFAIANSQCKHTYHPTYIKGQFTVSESVCVFLYILM